MTDAIKNEAEGSPKLGNPFSDSQLYVQIDDSPGRQRTKTHPLLKNELQTDHAPDHAPQRDFLLSNTNFSNSKLFRKNNNKDLLGKLQKRDVAHTAIEHPDVVNKMIKNGCTSLSEVFKVYGLQKLDSPNSEYHITIPLNQNYKDGHVSDDSVKRIFAATYSKDGLSFSRPSFISEKNATFVASHFEWCWLFGCESNVLMISWDSDFTYWKLLLPKEIHLTDQSGIPLLESHDLEEALKTLEFHNKCILSGDDRFRVVEESKRRQAAIENLIKLGNSQTFSCEIVPKADIFNINKKKMYIICGLDSTHKLLSESRKISFKGESVHAVDVKGLKKEHIESIYSYIVKADTSLCESRAQLGPFVLGKQETPKAIKKTGFEVILGSSFVVEVGTICFGKVSEVWFEGQIMHITKKNKVLFRRITRSASGQVSFSLAEDASFWILYTDLHNLETEPSDGAEVRRAEITPERACLFGKVSNKKGVLSFPYRTMTIDGLEDQIISEFDGTVVSLAYDLEDALIPGATCFDHDAAIRKLIWGYSDTTFEFVVPVFEYEKTLETICQDHSFCERIANILLGFLDMEKPSGSQKNFAVHEHSGILEILPTSKSDHGFVSVQTKSFSPWAMIKCDYAMIALRYSARSGLDICLYSRKFMYRRPIESTKDVAAESNEEVLDHRRNICNRIDRNDFEAASAEEKQWYIQAKRTTDFLKESYESRIQLLNTQSQYIPLTKSDYNNLWCIEFLADGHRIGRDILGPYEFNENEAQIIAGVLANLKHARKVDSLSFHIHKRKKGSWNIFSKSFERTQWCNYSVKNAFLDHALDPFSHAPDDVSTLAGAPPVPLHPNETSCYHTIISGPAVMNNQFAQRHVAGGIGSTMLTSSAQDRRSLYSGPSEFNSQSSLSLPIQMNNQFVQRHAAGDIGSTMSRSSAQDRRSLYSGPSDAGSSNTGITLSSDSVPQEWRSSQHTSIPVFPSRMVEDDLSSTPSEIDPLFARQSIPTQRENRL